MACAACGIAFEGEYCPDCGAPAGLVVPAAREGSLVSLRCGGYLIDSIVVTVISFGLSWLPVAGAFQCDPPFRHCHVDVSARKERIPLERANCRGSDVCIGPLI